MDAVTPVSKGYFSFMGLVNLVEIAGGWARVIPPCPSDTSQWAIRWCSGALRGNNRWYWKISSLSVHRAP